MLAFFQGVASPAFVPYIYTLRGGHQDFWFFIFSDLSIAAAHFAIVLVLLQVVFKTKDRLFLSVALLFALFIGFRGTTQLLALWTVVHPEYQLSDVIRTGTTVLSVATAIALIRLLPAMHRLPTAKQLAREVAERLQAEEELRVQGQRVRAVVESFQDHAIFLLDPQGRVQSWSRGGERIKGYTEQEILGKHFSCFYTPEDVAARKPDEMLRQAADAGKVEEEGWRLRRDGSRFWAHVVIHPLWDADRRLTGYSKITHDMTQSRELEARFQALMELAPDAILMTSSEGRIEFANAQVEQLYGYTRAEVVGQPISMLSPTRLREEYSERARQYFQFPSIQQVPTALDLELGFDLLGMRRDESEFSCEMSISPIETRAGVMALLSIRDITEQKRTVQQLAEKIEALRRSNEDLEQFAYIASHDLQEPLRMVASYTQLLARRYKGRIDSDADEFIDYAVDGTKRMKALIDDLLIYSRAGKGAPPRREFSSVEALEVALQNLRASIEDSGSEVTHDELPSILASDSQLVQLFQNLIGNAIKYRGARAPRIHVSAVTGEQEWLFSIADNGIGIEPQHFERIFIIFKRLHGRGEYEGTGIGLAICKRILQQQGGRIWVESEIGQGSTFHFALPMRTT